MKILNSTELADIIATTPVTEGHAALVSALQNLYPDPPFYPARLSGGFHFEYTKVFRAFPKLAITGPDDFIIFNSSSASFRNIVATPVGTGR